jgi:uncharacterized protein (TIGR02217 family)
MSAAFHEIRFPSAISRGATGGPERRTEIVALGSGHEQRNSRWAHSRRRYNAGYGVRNIDDIHAVLSFFEERRGRLHGFRWKDHADFRSCPPLMTPTPLDQEIAIADGIAAEFQLVKTYGSGEARYRRFIRKPVEGTVLLAVDGTLQAENLQYRLDITTGIITFLEGHVPAALAVVTAGFEFDAPVRFDSDYLEISLTGFTSGSIPEIPIVELRL